MSNYGLVIGFEFTQRPFLALTRTSHLLKSTLFLSTFIIGITVQ